MMSVFELGRMRHLDPARHGAQGRCWPERRPGLRRIRQLGQLKFKQFNLSPGGSGSTAFIPLT
jgi:hypothetical protein